MSHYINWVSANPLLSAAIQFAVLGTIGEILSSFIKNKKVKITESLLQITGKVIAWGILGLFIKYGFVAMKGAVAALLEHNLLPSFLAHGIGWAFTVSVITNLFFGPQMMFFHRMEDNIIAGRINFAGLENALYTLVWFWIPAHTVTFMLPKEIQIGLAALWSIVLGIILGITSANKNIEGERS